MTKHWTVLVTASLATLLAIFAPDPARTRRHFSVGVHQPRQPQPGEAAKHDARSRRRGRECRARRGPVVPQPDDGLPDRSGSDRRQRWRRQSDQRGPEPGQPHECVLRSRLVCNISLLYLSSDWRKLHRCPSAGRDIQLEQSHGGAALLDGQLPGPRLDGNRPTFQQSYRLELRRPEPHECELL